MEVSQAIHERRSVRKYLSTPVEWDKVLKIIEAAGMAPSAGNLQTWRFTVVTDKGLREAMAKVCYKQTWMADAPIHIVVCALHERCADHYGIRGERLYCVQDCAAAIQNMMLTAHDQGLGSCWVGAFDEDKLRDLMGIPGRARPQAIITFGYADDKPKQPEREPLYVTTYLQKYGNRLGEPEVVLKDYSVVWQKKIGAGKSAAKRLVENVKKKVSSKKNQ